MNSPLRYILILATCLFSQTLHAVPGDEHWSPEFGSPGVSNAISALCAHSGRLYVGGGSISTNTTLWVWDGLQWSVIGSFAGAFPTIYDLAIVGDTLYAAGSFTNVNGIPAKGLAAFNGATWADIGFNGSGYGLAVDGARLYVSGAFTNAGNVAATNIAAWEGGSWQSLGNGLGRISSDFVFAMKLGNGRLYAGGRFTNSGPAAITNLAQWDGVAWTNVGGAIGGASSSDRVYTLAIQGSDLYAGGIFASAGGVTANGLARWNGTTWAALGTGLPVGAIVNSLATYSNMVFVGGSFASAGGVGATNFAIWNGSTWAAAGTGLSAAAARVITDNGLVYVGGSFLNAGNIFVNNVATWDGSKWSQIGPVLKMQGVSSSVRALTTDGTNLYVGGNFTHAGQTNALRVARYDGGQWSAFGPGFNSNVNALAIVGTNLYAGGDFTGGPTRLAQWSGTNWAALPGFFSSAVNALAAQGNDLIVAGYFTLSTPEGPADWLARWDGASFHRVLLFGSNTLHLFYIDNIGFRALAVSGQNIYVSGHCVVSPCDETLNCTNSPNVMWFDGTYVRGLGTGINSNANAIAVMGTDVYFGGPFTNAGGVTVSGIARWDGSAWHDVGGGIVGRGTISALTAMGTSLYAGGTFTNIGGVTVNRIAKWNGINWSALGSGVAFSATAGPVSALASWGDDLYVGGTFRFAGNKSSSFLARWNENLNLDPGALQLSRPWRSSNGPFQFTVTSVSVPSYIVDRSTNLIDWVPLLTNSLTPLDARDSNTSAPRQFYRARPAP